MSKLSNVVTNEVVKKTDYNAKITEIENKIPDISNLATKTALNTVENKIPDTSGLVKKTDYNAKITEIEGKIPDLTNLATKAALTIVENKIPDVSSLAKKTDYNTKVTEIENKLNNHNHYKYIDTPEFNKLAGHVFNATLAQANLVTKTDFDDKLSNSNRKITKNKTDHALVQNELKKLITNYVLSWKSKRLSDNAIKPYATSNNSLTPERSYHIMQTK